MKVISVTVLSCDVPLASLPVVRQAVRNQRAGADSQADRMTIWLQNIESAFARSVTFAALFISWFLSSRGRR